jgi:type II secretion system protein N
VKERLRERLVTIATAIGYPLFYVICLVVSASWTFPFEKVRDRIVASWNESQHTSGSTRELAIADITSSWVTGIRLTGIRLVDHDAPREPGKPETKSELKIDSLVVRLALLPLLVGNHDVSFHADAFGGTVEGAWKDHGKDQGMEVTLAALDVGQLTPLTQFLEVPVEGTLAGTVKLDMPEGKVTKANGNVALEANDVAIGDGKSKLMGKLAVPRLTLGTFTVNADIKDGTAKVSKLGASGKDVDFLADARIPLHDHFTESLVDANARFRVSDAYRGKNEATKGLFGDPATPNMPAAIDLDPKMKQAKRPDGFYAMHFRGPVARLDWSPGGTGGPTLGPGGGGPGTTRPKGP